MRVFTIAAALAAALHGAAGAQDAPRFLAETYPSQALGPFLEGYAALKGEDAALDLRTFELIALAVAAQIPCDYCVYAHAKEARRAGATEAELRKAVAAAGMIRNLSTVLNGAAYDFEAFREEHDAMAPPVN